MTDTVVWIKLNIICVCFYIVCVCVVHSHKFVACFSRSSHAKSQIIAMTYHLYYTFCLHLNSNCVPCSVALGPFRASWNHFAWDSFRSFFGAGLLHFFFFPHFDVAWYLNSLYKPFCHANVQCFCVHSNYVNIHKIQHFPYTGGCSIFVLCFFESTATLFLRACFRRFLTVDKTKRENCCFSLYMDTRPREHTILIGPSAKNYGPEYMHFCTGNLYNWTYTHFYGIRHFFFSANSTALLFNRPRL